MEYQKDFERNVSQESSSARMILDRIYFSKNSFIRICPQIQIVTREVHVKSFTKNQND